MNGKTIRKALEDKGVYADKVAKRGDTIEVKRNYFYHNGQTALGWATKIAKALGPDYQVEGRDDWRAWPKDSHLVAIVRGVS